MFFKVLFTENLQLFWFWNLVYKQRFPVFMALKGSAENPNSSPFHCALSLVTTCLFFDS
jgi:hypothetical protein